MKEKNEIFVKTQGGRKSRKQHVGDCVTRSMSIAFNIDYKVMYNKLYDRARHYAKYGKSVTASYLRRNPRAQSPRNGCYYQVYEYWMKKLGFVKIKFTAKCYSDRVNFDSNFVTCLPKGTYVFLIDNYKESRRRQRHLVCVKDNIVHDSWDCHNYNYKVINMYTTKELGYNFNDKLNNNVKQLINTNG